MRDLGLYKSDLESAKGTILALVVESKAKREEAWEYNFEILITNKGKIVELNFMLLVAT